MSTGTKIYISLSLWLAICATMFFSGFKILDRGNHAALVQISKQKNQMLSLQAEAESYRLAQQDLRDVTQKKYQTSEFFSQDVTLVKEIEILESLGKTRGVNLSLGGISGTINTVPKAQTKGQLFLVPYSVSVNGPLNNVVDFIETLENLDFITTLNSLNITSAGDGNINASMGAKFYIRKAEDK